MHGSHVLITKVPITFSEQDFRLKSTNHNDAMIIEVNIARWVIGKILIENRCSADIIFIKTFELAHATTARIPIAGL
jgi:hypothetical protein